MAANSSVDVSQHFCLNSIIVLSFNTLFQVLRLLLFPALSIFILRMSFLQWQQQRSFKSASHSDVFTYHQSVLQLVWSLGTVIFIGGVFFELHLLKFGYFFANFIVPGETSFHVLTCMDRYLAVVHPTSYRQLRLGRGVWIRNASILSVWLLCLMWSFDLLRTYPDVSEIPFFCLLGSSLLIVCFCSLSVLHSLMRSGPGEGLSTSWRRDQTKQRAFFTVMAIMGVLCFWFLGFLVSTALSQTVLLDTVASCVLHNSIVWLSFPSSLVLPLLYLHKKGKLPCWKNGNA